MRFVIGMVIETLNRLDNHAGRAGCARSATRVNLSLDDGEAFELLLAPRAAKVLSSKDLPFPLGMDEALERILGIESTACLASLAELQARRDHSSMELESKLRSLGFRDEAIVRAIELGRERRYLDDRRFASSFIAERKRRGWGRKKIEFELKRKGIVLSDIPGYPDDYFDSSEDYERAIEALRRKSVPEARAFEKLTRFLMGRGFDYSTSSRAVRSYLDSESEA